ncbi:glycosyltransferase family 4 protein [Neoroseomonas soli]|uniref:Glycosyltransferase family 4 protein n=1 Tax=Neoroseomonas soli TaxID=1081025 RepID=A0A9X9WSM4_9PROT|nr:glycosyltransferase family 4 protein [Neoroseomonas soli]MBR0670153.1 glycosyltransferase family 4 protein [Neoroseomonas soli]
MRILYSHRIQSRDGQGVHLDALVAALREAGHEVRVVGPAAYDRAALGGESRLLARLRRWLPAWAGEVAEIAYALPACLRLRRAAREFAPDVIYERANLFHFAGACTGRRLGIPLILEVNSPLAEERGRFGGLRLRRLAAAAETHVWRSADVVLPVTAVLAGRIAAAGVPAERIVVIPNGIDLADFAALPARGEDDTLVLGFVGFVRAWHGLDGVLRGLAAWQGSQRLSLLVVGDGPARPDLERLAAELGIADRVSFTGLAAREEVPALVARFDIALQPASVPYASPLKVFEYMAAGRPILAPDQPNIREVLEDGRTALLFDPGREGALWEGVQRLAADAGLRARLGEAARQEVLRRDLTWAGNARRVVALAEAARARLPATAEQTA